MACATECSSRLSIIISSSSSSSSSSSQFSAQSSAQSSLSMRRLKNSKKLHLQSQPRKMRSIQAHTICPPPPSSPSSSSASSVSPVSVLSAEPTMEEIIQTLQSSIAQSPDSAQSAADQSWDQNPLWKSTRSFTGSKRSSPSDLNPFQRLLAAALDAAEKHLIPKLEGDHLPATADPEIQLQGNFSPVDESPVSGPLQIQGTLPDDLEGLYVRNGANPRFKPLAGHHLFDGDGMLHAVRIKNQTASYCSRFTRTNRLCEEERLGRAFFPKPIGELHGHGGLARLALFAARSALGLVDGSEGMGPANAGVVFFDGKLLAMSEDDQPYAVQIDPESGDVSTIGRYDFHGQLNCSSMLAHPKKDSRTGELFNLSYDVVKRPYVRYFCFAADGSKRSDVEIPIAEPTMIHDFAITENFVVVPDQQVVFRLQRMISGQSPVVYDPEKKSRFGVLPKYGGAANDVRWVEVPDCFCLHVWNAWEEEDGDAIVVLASCMTPPDAIFNEHKQEMSSVLCKIRLDMKSGTSTRTPIAEVNLEAGTVNKGFLGKKSRFLYLAIAEPWPKVSGIAKVDLEKKDLSSSNCVVGQHYHGDGCYGGEPFFVARSSDPEAAEDDGYILTFVHNETSGMSELRILDASSDNLDLIAAVKLPSRVPYGFHGTFVSESDLASQHSEL